ncbi:zinc finger BED domain-containing protein 5-like [Rhopalosiphum padi]|uniref:zinc finger BED domain-containing protein 5-like n=1 Tax=Rhopalosiphum padi TaxID=40932 RepID=UPI00298DCE88|nr:zinc finger BED domain-containing protein 5-like [Rhopalosiphum padi]
MTYVLQVSEPPKKKTKLNIRRQYYEDYLNIRFSWSGNVDDPRSWCLVCGEKLSKKSMVPSKLKRHFSTKHSHLVDKNASYFQRLLKSETQKSEKMTKKETISDKTQEASYLVAELVAKQMKTHTIAEKLILPACREIVKVLFGEEAEKEVLKIPVSENTISRRIEHMSEDIEEQVLRQSRDSPLFALQLDESTDISGQAQLLIFIRIVSKENVLCCKTLSETTKDEDIFEIVDNYLKFANLPWDKCIEICTDGAPAMTGSVKGFTSFAKKKNENIIFTHCFLHREALITKTLVGDLKEVLDQVVKAINFIKSSSLKSSAIRWLSRGRVLSCFYDLSEEIIVFLTIEESKYEFLGDEKWWTNPRRTPKTCVALFYFSPCSPCAVQPPSDATSPSHSDNRRYASTLTDKIMAFNEKITLWKTQVDQKKLTMFPRTAERDVDLISLISESIMLLKEKMTKYIPSINFENYDWVRNPFSVSVNEVIGLTFAEEDNLISLKNDRTIKLKFKEMTVNKFWIYAQAEFPEISIKAITILLPFSTSYLCEQGFSAVTTIKSKKENDFDP